MVIDFAAIRSRNAKPEKIHLCHCENCGFTAPSALFPEAQNLHLRLAPGDVYTSIECPKCEALAHPVNATIAQSVTLQALHKCLGFVEGFEGDESQEGINELLILIKRALLETAEREVTHA